ncbi:MAG: hypothetical protein ACRDIB_06770, partial [Ardenticatenaceae bacterium]
MRAYSLYGLTITTTIPFRAPLRPSNSPPTLTVDDEHGTRSVASASLLSTVPEQYWNSVTIQRAIRWTDGQDGLLFPGGDQVVVGHGRMTYVHAGHHPPRPDWVDARLLG